MYAADTQNKVLKARSFNELEWIDKVAELSNGKFVVEEWQPDFSPVGV